MLILLVGPKGSGKSHIGRLLERALGVHFLHVEPLWMAWQASCREKGIEMRIEDGIEVVHPAIDAALEHHDRVCVETTGASPEILADLLRLGQRHGLFVARVHAGLETCLARIESRDPTHQIPMQEEMIRKVHAIATKLELDSDVTIYNEEAHEPAILDHFRAAFDHRARRNP